MNIFPALLSDSRLEIQNQLDQLAEASSDIETVQLDIIDGKFADNLTISPSDMPDIDWHDFSVDLHLMTEEPLDYVYELIDVHEQLSIRAVIGQVERMSNPTHFLEDVEKNGWLPGVSLDIFTPIDTLDADSLRFIKVIQVMGIEAGAQGKQFNPLALDKIRQLALPCKNLGIELIVDGGVNGKTITTILNAGATGVAVGSALWKSSSLSDTIEELQQLGRSSNN